MAMNDAMKLIGAIGDDPSLRREMVSCTSLNELKEYLFNKGFQFSNHEFEEAVNVLHVKCQTFENADNLMAKAEWFNYLLYSMS
jgi:hypothetical protein